MTRPPNVLDTFNAPFSQEAEEATIGAVLVNPGMFIQLAAFLKPDDFFLLRHNYIWQALMHLSDRNEPVDYVLVTEELANMRLLDDIGGYAYLIQLMNNTPSSIHAEAYARLVERTSVRRKLMTVAEEIKQLAMDETSTLDNVISDAEAKLFGVSDSQIKRSFVPMWEALSDYYDRMEQMLMNRGVAVGVPTGFRDLDQLLGGFQRSDLLVFAGRPGMGKCIVGESLVETAFGQVALETLKPQDHLGIPDDEGGVYYPLTIAVQTPTGLQTTSHFYDGGIKATLKITTRLGYALSGTHNHPVFVLNGDGDAVWKPLSALHIGDYVAVMRVTQAQTHHIAEYARHAPTSWLTARELLPANYDWDAIVALEDDGLQAVYDLVVPEGHAFVANGILCHNTSFLLTIALNAARVGARIAIFTMEMGVEQIVQRIVSMESAINVQNLRLGRLTPQEQARFTEVVGRLSNLNIFIDDTPAASPLDIRTKARRLHHEHGLDMIIIDYMQLMNAGKGYENNRVQEISYISRSLKELARELNVPLISAAQLSRAVEQRQDKRPVLSDLRESGSIEQDADIVMFLYRDEIYNEATEYPNQADVIVAKHRNGPTGTISLYFEKSLTKFMDATTHRVDLSDLQ